MDAAEPVVGAEDARVPSVVASHVDIVYRVFGAGRSTVRGARGRGWRRWIDRGSRHMGVREVQAVSDVSFVAYRGETIGLIGRNGSGKSTLLRAVAGLVPPDAGEIYLGGDAALLGVNAVLMRKLTGARNIMIGGQALGMSKAQVRARYRDIVKFADIGEFLHLPMSAYSSGMAARLRFAISTAQVPDILVVDEALATGDREFKDKAAARIQEIRQSAGTVFMVSHSESTITSLCDRALWMEQGRLIMDGPATEVVAAYQAKYGKPPASKKVASKKPTTQKSTARKPSAPRASRKGTPTTPEKVDAEKGRAEKKETDPPRPGTGDP